MDFSKFSRPPKRNSKLNVNNYTELFPDKGRSTKKVTTLLAQDYDTKQNVSLSTNTRSTKQIKFNMPETLESRAGGGRSRSILMASSVTNHSNYENRTSKSKSRWEEKTYVTKDKVTSQFSSSNYKSYKLETDTNAKFKEDILKQKPKPFHEKLNQFTKEEDRSKNFLTSSFYKKDASHSKNKFSSTFTKSRVSDQQENIPFFNQNKVMHETYHHPISYSNFQKSQVLSKNNFMPREKIWERKETPMTEPKLNDFIVGQCKGEGRFGKVYMAIHKKTGFLCALKKIRKDAVKYMIDQFIQEIKIQLFLNHSKLVKMFGYFSDEEHFYMLIEYMEEGSLYSLMKKVKKFEESAAIEKIKQICEGIKQMHDNSIVHRDLKPQNVVMSNGVCKICDFGWAAICQGRRQTYCGTLDYVCPEIIEGTSYDSSVDIWCLGVLAYEMLCGKAPFYDISRKKTMQKIVSCKIESFPSYFSRKAVKFIEMALQKDPIHRVGVEELLQSEFLKGAKI